MSEIAVVAVFGCGVGSCIGVLIALPFGTASGDDGVVGRWIFHVAQAIGTIYAGYEATKWCIRNGHWPAKDAWDDPNRQ